MRHRLQVLALMLALAVPARGALHAQGLEEVRPTKVRVRMLGEAGGGEFTGSATRIAEDTLRLVSGKRVRLLPVDDIASIDEYVGRHIAEGAVLGTIAGGVAGYVAAVLVENPPEGCADPDAIYCGTFTDAAGDVALGAVAGAAIGTTIGLLIPKWQRIRADNIHVIPVMPEGRPGVALVLPLPPL
jgi:hypothetical protein